MNPHYLYQQETYINSTEGHMFGESDMMETDETDVGRLFKISQREYGRCVSKVYIDHPDGGEPMPIGWVFVKLMGYEDSPKKYLREVWVCVYDKPDTVTRVKHYHDLRVRQA